MASDDENPYLRKIYPGNSHQYPNDPNEHFLLGYLAKCHSTKFCFM